MSNQNELIYKSDVFVLGNICNSPAFNVDRISERCGSRFYVKRNVSQVKCCMAKEEM